MGIETPCLLPQSEHPCLFEEPQWGLKPDFDTEARLYKVNSKNPNGDWNVELSDKFKDLPEFEEPQWGLKLGYNK